MCMGGLEPRAAGEPVDRSDPGPFDGLIAAAFKWIGSPWVLCRSRAEFFEGDTSRLYRMASTAEHVTYAVARQLLGFEVSAYFWPWQGIEDLLFFTSTSGATWDTCILQRDTPGGDREKVEYDGTGLPTGVTHLRIEFANLNTYPAHDL